MKINEQLEQGQKEHGVSATNYFRFNDGDNRIRVLTAGAVIATHFFGKGKKASTCYGETKGCPFHGEDAPKRDDGSEQKPSIKTTCYVVRTNEKDARVQLADLPYSVIKQIGDYQTSEDYGFGEDEYPMPYDITVKFNEKSKSPNDMYKVLPSPKRAAVSKEILEQLEAAMAKLTPEQSVQKKKDWQIRQHTEAGIIKSTTATKEELKEANEVSKKYLDDQEGTPIEYPTNDISPDDIKF